MPLTESKMVGLGTPAPTFSLIDVNSGEPSSLDALKGAKGTLVMFICNHCPYVRYIEQGIRELARDYEGRGIAIIAICANDAGKYPDDAPEKMREKGYPFPYLHDTGQDVARAYGAECTPDFFLFDDVVRLVYRGRFDSARPGNGEPVTGADLRAALDRLLAGETIPTEQKPSMGCNIKWRD